MLLRVGDLMRWKETDHWDDYAGKSFIVVAFESLGSVMPPKVVIVDEEGRQTVWSWGVIAEYCDHLQEAQQ